MKNRKIQQHTSILWLLFGVFMCAVISTSAADEVKMGEVPKEVQDAINGYKDDTTSGNSFNEVKKLKWFNSDIKLSDIKIGIPIQEYRIVPDSLDKLGKNTSIKELVKPTGQWKVPIWAHGKCIYFLKLALFDNRLQRIGACNIKLAEHLKKVRDVWPEYTQFDPVIISHNHRSFFHFPKKNDYNLLYLHPRIKNDPLDEIVPSHLSDTISDKSLMYGKEILLFLRKENSELKRKQIIDKGGGK